MADKLCRDILTDEHLVVDKNIVFANVATFCVLFKYAIKIEENMQYVVFLDHFSHKYHIYWAKFGKNTYITHARVMFYGQFALKS